MILKIQHSRQSSILPRSTLILSPRFIAQRKHNPVEGTSSKNPEKIDWKGGIWHKLHNTAFYNCAHKEHTRSSPPKGHFVATLYLRHSHKVVFHRPALTANHYQLSWAAVAAGRAPAPRPSVDTPKAPVSIYKALSSLHLTLNYAQTTCLSPGTMADKPDPEMYASGLSGVNLSAVAQVCQNRLGFGPRYLSVLILSYRWSLNHQTQIMNPPTAQDQCSTCPKTL